MGVRRDDITNAGRMQITIEVLSSNRDYGMITGLAQQYDVSRQTIYDIANKGQQVLLAGLHPGSHGPHPSRKCISVDRDLLVRGSVVLTEAGVSQRDVCFCLEELLDSKVSLGWVNTQLAKVEERAAFANEAFQPEIEESLSGDEMYSNDHPNLLLVGNDSLYIYELSRQPDCEGETWGILLSDKSNCLQFASDAGTGLSAGVKAAEIKVHQLDWEHLLRPLWGQAARLEKQAYAVLKELEERSRLFDQTTTPGRLQQHLDQWERLNDQATEKIAVYDAFYRIARSVDDCFALIDLNSSQLQDATTCIQKLKALGEQLEAWSGRIYQKLSSNLKNWASRLFSYQAVLKQVLDPLKTRFGPQGIAALCRIWQIEANQRRRASSLPEKQQQQIPWEESLDEAIALMGEENLWKAWNEVCLALGHSWRGSMLAECVNGLLRTMLNKRKHTDQGCLELFRFLHNTRAFNQGKRAGYSPAKLAGLEVPDDPLLLLGIKEKCQSN